MVEEKPTAGSIAGRYSEAEGDAPQTATYAMGKETCAVGSRWLFRGAREVSQRLLTQGKGFGSLTP